MKTSPAVSIERSRSSGLLHLPVFDLPVVDFGRNDEHRPRFPGELLFLQPVAAASGLYVNQLRSVVQMQPGVAARCVARRIGDGDSGNTHIDPHFDRKS